MFCRPSDRVDDKLYNCTRTCIQQYMMRTRIFRDYIPRGKCVVEQFNYGVLMMIGASVSEPLHW